MGAGKLGGWCGGPRGEQNCGRLPSVTDPPQQLLKFQQQNKSLNAPCEVFLGEKNDWVQGSEGQTGKSPRGFGR